MFLLYLFCRLTYIILLMIIVRSALSKTLRNNRLRMDRAMYISTSLLLTTYRFTRIIVRASIHNLCLLRYYLFKILIYHKLIVPFIKIIYLFLVILIYTQRLLHPCCQQSLQVTILLYILVHRPIHIQSDMEQQFDYILNK